MRVENNLMECLSSLGKVSALFCGTSHHVTHWHNLIILSQARRLLGWPAMLRNKREGSTCTYASLAPSYILVPVCIGAWGESARSVRLEHV